MLINIMIYMIHVLIENMQNGHEFAGENSRKNLTHVINDTPEKVLEQLARLCILCKNNCPTKIQHL